MPHATADVSSTTFSSLQLIMVMPTAITGTRMSRFNVTNLSKLQRASHSKIKANMKQTHPVMGCTRAASCSFESCPKKEAGSESCVMNWINDHFKEV
eukprot:CAMPEP_0175190682 /NCGR_PEP_ID=MMETSP0093-20121207/4560_1 /TAXON_ID=311494 /ORGANISM="Alexandrium monilatum, Strain CCMP3105" /LENGTH=96 /DNA_ID=CAMNT_0016483497 /DNA_START=168 /DNA_END=454 /DNA_ORIENTATION=+